MTIGRKPFPTRSQMGAAMSDWRKHVPKGPVLQLEWWWQHFYFARLRGANFHRLQIGWLTVICRAPYLEHVARIHHPHLFTGFTATAAALAKQEGE